MDVLEAIVTSVISALLAGAVTWYIALKKMPHETKVMDSEESENLATTLNLVVTTLQNTVVASNSERKNLTSRIEELEAHRDMRSREIYALQQNLEQLNREYAKEVTSLQEKVRNLETQANESREKYERLKQYTNSLREAMKFAGLSVSEVPADLLDTIDKIVLPKSVKGHN